MATLPQPIARDYFRRLHHGAVDETADVEALLRRVQREGVLLDNGFDGFSNSRRARIVWLRQGRMGLAAEFVRPERQPQLCWTFDLEGSRYFFVTPSDGARDRTGILDVEQPDVVYRAERRDSPRSSAIRESADASVELASKTGWRRLALVTDASPGGLGVALRNEASSIPTELEVRFLGDDESANRAFGTVRYRSRESERPGWIRLGLSLTNIPPSSLIPVEQRSKILDERSPTRASGPVGLLAAAAKSTSYRVARHLGVASRVADVEVVEYESSEGKPIRALVDRNLGGAGGTAVVIPPAWGRTKETLLPLALTIKGGFEAAGEPCSIVRFDGTHRRGESFVEPQFRSPGDEYLGFTFSQAVRDIHSTIEFLAASDAFKPSRVILVTVSMASIEGRRAVAEDPTGLISGWVSLVGICDLQSCLRVASGGVDFGPGLASGVSFGTQELTGVVVDMDVTGPDVVRHRLGYLEDGFRDMQKIAVPITWIHGRHDGWMEVERVQRLLSSGGHNGRRLIEVPTGHQLQSSAEALEVFQLVAEEALRLSVGRKAAIPPVEILELERRRTAERARRPKIEIDSRSFWRDYLIGRDGRVGIEMLTATSAYRDLMSRQIDGLDLEAGDSVLDLGSGTDGFAVALADTGGIPAALSVTALDLVVEGLKRGQRHLRRSALGSRLDVKHIVADLDVGNGHRIPLASNQFDAAIASLLISYVREPKPLLSELMRVLRPGGRLVISTLRRDADTSRLLLAAWYELHPARIRKLFGDLSFAEFEDLRRGFVNDNARIFDLEEAGVFRFFDSKELLELVEQAGFSVRGCDKGFGDPPQAVIAMASKPG